MIPYQSSGSGWIFQHWNGVKIKIIRYQPLSGGSYIPTPATLKNRKCLLNIRNKDSSCFLYAMVAAYKTPKTNRTAPGFYKQFFNRFDMSGRLSIFFFFFLSIGFNDARIYHTSEISNEI